MRRFVVRAPGGYEALELVDEADPRPGPGQVRVAVQACGVNYADSIVRMGYYEAAKGLYPVTPGFEFAGRVDALGPGSAGFTLGQPVFGVTRFGGYASSLAVDARQLWPCPEGWSPAESAAFPAVHLTAYAGLFRVGHVEADETVLVHSAAGGAGSAFVQLAKAAGCRVLGVVGSPHKAAFCRELGCDGVVVRSESDLWAEADRFAPRGFDAIFDANGITTLKPGFQRLARGGRLVVYGFAEILPRGPVGRPGLLALAWNWLRVPRFSPLDMTTTNRSVAGFNVVFMFDQLDYARRAMERMSAWIREGKLRKPRVTAFPFERAADAHKAIESGATTGKLVLAL